MIDLKALRENPDRFKLGAQRKGVSVDIDRVIELDSQIRSLTTERETLKAEQNRLAKESGPKIGQLMGKMKAASGDEKVAIEAEVNELRSKPAQLKEQVSVFEEKLAGLEPELRSLLLQIPLPPDSDVPVGTSADDNIEISTWAPDDYDLSRSFEQNRGFAPKTHIELIESLGLVDFERGVKVAGTRSYVLAGDGMRLHQAILRYAFDRMVDRHGFKPMSVPVLVRGEAMEGTGFFPAGRDQTYHIEESKRGAGHDMYLTGTGEVGLMGLHADEILDKADLPL